MWPMILIILPPGILKMQHAEKHFSVRNLQSVTVSAIVQKLKMQHAEKHFSMRNFQSVTKYFIW